MDVICSHKEFDKSCRFCEESRTDRDNRAEEVEERIAKCYEEGGFRGITKYILDTTVPRNSP